MLDDPFIDTCKAAALPKGTLLVHTAEVLTPLKQDTKYRRLDNDSSPKDTPLKHLSKWSTKLPPGSPGNCEAHSLLHKNITIEMESPEGAGPPTTTETFLPPPAKGFPMPPIWGHQFLQGMTPESRQHIEELPGWLVLCCPSWAKISANPTAAQAPIATKLEIILRRKVETVMGVTPKAG